jgi:hypothetical protein
MDLPGSLDYSRSIVKFFAKVVILRKRFKA